MAIWIGPESGIDDLDVVFGNMLWVVFMLGIETFFEGIIHSIDGSFSVFIAIKGVDVLLLDKEENQ